MSLSVYANVLLLIPDVRASMVTARALVHTREERLIWKERPVPALYNHEVFMRPNITGFLTSSSSRSEKDKKKERESCEGMTVYSCCELSHGCFTTFSVAKMG